MMDKLPESRLSVEGADICSRPRAAKARGDTRGRRPKICFALQSGRVSSQAPIKVLSRAGRTDPPPSQRDHHARCS